MTWTAQRALGPEPTRQRILEALKQAGVDFEHRRHPVPTSAEQAAEFRGVPVAAMTKTLLVKVGDTPALYTLSATARLDSRALRKQHSARKAHFLSPAQLLEATGLIPYTVPPFGRPVLPFQLYVDRALLAFDRVAFGLGSRTESVTMASKDWHRVSVPLTFRFSI